MRHNDRRDTQSTKDNMKLETEPNERASIRHALQRYVFMTLVYGWITLGLIIASKKNLLHESQISTVLNIVFNGGLDFEFLSIILVSTIFTNGIYSFIHPINSRIFACEAIGSIFLTLGALGSYLPIIYSILFDGTLRHIASAFLSWVAFGFLGIIFSDFKLLERFLRGLTTNH